MRVKTASMILLSVIFSQYGYSQNYMFNGSFENGTGTTCNTGGSGCVTDPTSCYFCGSTGTFIPGWSLDNGNIDRYRSGLDPVSDLYNGAAEGLWGIDMDGNNPATISQTVNGLPTPSSAYILSFSISNNRKEPNCQQDKPIRVNVYNASTSALIATQDYSTSAYSTLTNTWGSVSLTFTPNTSSIKIEFVSLFGSAATTATCGSGAFTSFYGPTLDNVVLTPASILPMRFVMQSLETDKEKVKLNWQVSEINKLKAFKIEFAPKGKDFISIDSLPLNGDKTSFSYERVLPHESGIYRIKAEDLSGNNYYSRYFPVMVKPVSMYVRQVCAGAEVNIKADKIELYDLKGNLLKTVSQTETGFYTLKLEGLAQGIYVVKAFNTEGEELVQRVAN